MISPLTALRRAAHSPVALAAAATCVAALIAITSTTHTEVDAAGTLSGAVQFSVPAGSPTAGQTLTSGGSATQFNLKPPAGSTCTGDSATGGYRVQTYMVPTSVNPADLTFNALGPLFPAGTDASLYRSALYNTSGSLVVNLTTGIADASGGGLVTSNLPVMSWGAIPGTRPTPPAGTYNVGIACTRSAGSVMDKYWNIELTVTADATDSPAGITWSTVTTPVVTTTTAAATTTTAASTTTSTTASASTTTVAGATTTIDQATTTVAAATDTTLDTTDTTEAFGSLAVTGSRPLPLVLWALLALIVGRMVVLIGKPVRVLPGEAR